MADTIRFEFIAQERIILQDDVNMVIAPGAGGVLGILPRHAPLMAVIAPGELVVKKEGQADRYYAVGGGFMEVRPDKVILLARSGESAEEIDLTRAQEARRAPLSRAASSHRAAPPHPALPTGSVDILSLTPFALKCSGTNCVRQGIVRSTTGRPA